MTPKQLSERQNFFTDAASMKTIDRRRIMYFLIALGCFVLTEVGRFVYRPFAYESGINDYGLADSVGNLGGIIVQIFFGLGVMNASGIKAFRLMGFFVVGYVLYEVLQLYLPRGVFDWRDVYATLVGGVMATGILLLVRRMGNNKVIYQFP